MTRTYFGVLVGCNDQPNMFFWVFLGTTNPTTSVFHDFHDDF